MRPDLATFRRFSLTTQLILSYLVILGIGGLVTSLVGSWIVSSTIMEQARRTALHDIAAAHTIYEQRLGMLKRSVQLTAAEITIRQRLYEGEPAGLERYLDEIRQQTGFDFISFADADGHIVARATPAGAAGGRLPALAVVAAALAGNVAAATELMTAPDLAAEDPALPERARIHVVSTPHAADAPLGERTTGLVLAAAAPVRAADSALIGVLYGGILLNRNYSIVDRVAELVYRGETFRGQPIGSVTIFQGDTRIATTVRNGNGERAIGTRVSGAVQGAVLERGAIWNDRAFVVRDWYISTYEPIRDYHGNVVGMLYVGLLEKLYLDTRNRVIASFFAIASLGFAAILLTTYFIIRRVTSPLVQMAEATRGITAGRFDQTVRDDLPGELGLLAVSFNTMLRSLSQMRADLEEWGRTLEEKVHQRTDELAQMQARVAQSERLASLGMLSAGVAHEINNPLGGILALTALTVEDTPDADPRRENLLEVLRQTERCRDIVKGLLEFARQSRAAEERVDVHVVLENTLALMVNKALFFNIEVQRDFAEDLPPVVADRSQLQQVFMNIIVNAVQAMEEKGTLRLRTRHYPEDGEVEIAISDTGHGIEATVLDHIFDPFFTTKESGQGTGLGLSIAYGIVTRHAGSIAVESRVGVGTTFTIRFPAGSTQDFVDETALAGRAWQPAGG
jgi:two-component system, NtrC family, sensor kinase